MIYVWITSLSIQYELIILEKKSLSMHLAWVYTCPHQEWKVKMNRGVVRKIEQTSTWLLVELAYTTYCLHISLNCPTASVEWHRRISIMQFHKFQDYVPSLSCSFQSSWIHNLSRIIKYSNVNPTFKTLSWSSVDLVICSLLHFAKYLLHLLYD